VDGQTDRQTDILITLLCKRYRGGSDYKSLYATDTYFGHTNYNTSTILSSTAGNNTITAVINEERIQQVIPLVNNTKTGAIR